MLDLKLPRLDNSNSSRLTMVCHCEKEPGEILRIISAKKATGTNEQKFYKGDLS